MSNQTTVRPFRVEVPEEDLAELRRRIDATKWPERETVDDDSQGVPLATMQDLARYWATEYDWRKCEARLNAVPNFMTELGLLPGTAGARGASTPPMHPADRGVPHPAAKRRSTEPARWGRGVSDPTPHTDARPHPADRHYQQQLARTLRVAGNMAITLAVIGPAASVFAIGSLALRQQGSGAFLAFLIAALIMPFIAAARLAGPPSPRICWPRATARDGGGSGMVRT